MLVAAAVTAPVVSKGLPTGQQFDRWQDVANAYQSYVQDWDDTSPLMTSFNTTNRSWRPNSFYAVPAGSSTQANRHKPPRSIEERSACLNALLPYLSSTLSYSDPSLPFTSPLVTTTISPSQPYPVNVLYNGLLHTWNVNSVATPDRLSAFVQNYRENNTGLALALPMLCCTATNDATCQFNPTGYPQQGQTACVYYGPGYGDVWFLNTRPENFSVWVYGHGEVFLSVNGTARVQTLESPTWPQYAENVNDNPWSSFDPVGVPGSPYLMSYCVEPGGDKREGHVYYSGHFRPDNEFDYTLQQCDFGGD